MDMTQAPHALAASSALSLISPLLSAASTRLPSSGQLVRTLLHFWVSVPLATRAAGGGSRRI
jgi:hypothetical protein